MLGRGSDLQVRRGGDAGAAGARRLGQRGGVGAGRGVQQMHAARRRPRVGSGARGALHPAHLSCEWGLMRMRAPGDVSAVPIRRV